MKPKSNFTIIIATRWASEYLKLCIETLKKHSDLDNEIIIAADYPSWQTLKYIQENNLPYILTNFGHQCMAWNTAAQFSTREYIAIAGDDVVFGQGWDTALMGIGQVCGSKAVGCLMQYDPGMGEEYKFGYDGNIKTFNLDQFIKYGENHRQDKFVETLSWPLIFRRDLFWKYGGLTFHSSRGHGHDLQLANRIITNEHGTSIRSLKSYIYHFGPTGNRDEGSKSYLSTEYGSDGVKICAGCLKSEKGFGGNEDQPESIEINRRGYWLCDTCKKSGNINIRRLPPLIIS